ncbi:MAG: radical SAM protein [Rhodospirillales bacterium]
MSDPDVLTRPRAKFTDPDLTAAGEPRATVALQRLDTLWFNTGTLCNITCRNCYIGSSPQNDLLAYLSAAECAAFLDEIAQLRLGTREIGFTGGEPFLNPHMLAMAEDALRRGHEVLILTNGMQPMMRPRIKAGLQKLRDEHGDRLAIRVSLDHHGKLLHEAERGKRTWDKVLAGIDWLSESGCQVAIAGRTCWGETVEQARAGYAALIASRGWRIDAGDPRQLVLLPEMDSTVDVPEISTGCWKILGRQPSEVMCASSRMIVKRKGARRPVVMPCTLLPYETAFEMGSTLAASLAADGGMFRQGAVKLCHAHCAKFCS